MFSNVTLGIIATLIVIIFLGWIGYEAQSNKINQLELDKKNLATKGKVDVAKTEAKSFTQTQLQIKDVMLGTTKVIHEEVNLSDGNHTITFGK